MQQIVKPQKRKKMLAEVTFSQSPLSEDGIRLGILQVRFQLIELRPEMMSAYGSAGIHLKCLVQVPNMMFGPLLRSSCTVFGFS